MVLGSLDGKEYAIPQLTLARWKHGRVHHSWCVSARVLAQTTESRSVQPPLHVFIVLCHMLDMPALPQHSLHQHWPAPHRCLFLPLIYSAWSLPTRPAAPCFKPRRFAAAPKNPSLNGPSHSAGAPFSQPAVQNRPVPCPHPSTSAHSCCPNCCDTQPTQLTSAWPLSMSCCTHMLPIYM
jgi:hypothetical protein